MDRTRVIRAPVIRRLPPNRAASPPHRLTAARLPERLEGHEYAN